MNLNLRTGTTCEFVLSGPGKVNEQRERDLTGCRMSRPKASVDVGYYPNGDVGLQVKHEDEQIVNVRMARDLVVGALAEWMTQGSVDRAPRRKRKTDTPAPGRSDRSRAPGCTRSPRAGSSCPRTDGPSEGSVVVGLTLAPTPARPTERLRTTCDEILFSGFASCKPLHRRFPKRTAAAQSAERWRGTVQRLALDSGG